MVVVILGACLRVAEYLAVRSLWLDEAMLANNIVGRTVGGLFRPLAESQNAPWLFLVGEHTVALVLGPNELALRLLPLVAGVLLPWLVWLTAKQLVDPETGIVAALVAALSPLLLYYANEVKPYGVDALVGTALVLATLRVLDSSSDREPWLTLLLAGVVALLTAFPATFVLGACWCALVASADARRSPHARRMLPLAAVLWTATFALPYLLVIRPAKGDVFLASYFSSRFLVPWQSSAVMRLWRLWDDVSVEVFLGRDALASAPQMVVVVSSIVLLALCGAGVWEIKRRRGAAGVLVIAGPMLMALFASTLRMYPLAVRLWTFSAPFWAILAAAGLRAVVTRVRAGMSARVSALATAGLVATAGVDAMLGLTNPYWRRAHVRPLVRALQEEQRTTGDPIYVMAHAVPQWLFYTTAWRSDPAPSQRDSASRWLEGRTCVSQGTHRARSCQLLGAYSGVEYSEIGGFTGVADSAWGDREIARLQAVAAPCGWVLMHLPYPGEPAALANAVERRGGHVQNALEDRMHPNRDAATKAFRVCFGIPSQL